MTLPPASRTAAARHERLANWLALLALLALGILAPCPPGRSAAAADADAAPRAPHPSARREAPAVPPG